MNDYERDEAPDPRALLTPATAAEVLTLAAAVDGRRVERPTAEAWAEILSDVRAGDAKAALVEHYRESPHPVTPADILRIVREWWEDWAASGAGAFPPRGSYDEHAPIGMCWPPGDIEPLGVATPRAEIEGPR